MSDDSTAVKSARFACSDAEERRLGIDAAVAAIQRGDVIVLPTDTVYGIAADAFEPDAVERLLGAKGRGRDMPPPVLVGAMSALSGVALEVTDAGRALVEAFWPGALTVICPEQPSLAWDIGDNNGTVAVRMPDNEVALEVLRRTGPLAVSSANKSGQPAATTAEDAQRQLGDEVAVYLDGGSTPGAEPSSIVDLTRAVPCLVRVGAISLERLREVVPELVGVDELTEAEAEAAAEAPPATPAEPTSEAATETTAETVAEPGAENAEEPDRAEAERPADTAAEAADEPTESTADAAPTDTAPADTEPTDTEPTDTEPSAAEQSRDDETR